MFTVFIYPPHPGILPPQVTKQLHKNAQLNLQKIFFSISHPPIYVQAFHVVPKFIKNIIANSCTQLYVCLYHMILAMSFLYFQ
jgi:hypothetical protein